MHYELHVAGVGACLPGFHLAADAVDAGVYPAENHERDSYTSVSVAEEPPPELAVRAARQAMDQSGLDPADIAIVLHASVSFQGVDFWPAAYYVHREVLAGGRHTPAIDVSQMSNSGLSAVELAAAYLMAAPGRRAALITCAERFRLPAVDRWRSDNGVILGDGAAALVLTRTAGIARVLALRTIVDSRLEGLFRGAEPFGDASGHYGPVDFARRKAEYLAEVDRDITVRRIKKGTADAIDLVLKEAGTDLSGIARVVLPALGLTALRRGYLEPLGLPLEATTWDLGRRTGHVGGADQLIGLDHLIRSGTVAPGERVLLVGIGAGFSWTCAVLEMTSRLTATGAPVA